MNEWMVNWRCCYAIVSFSTLKFAWSATHICCIGCLIQYSRLDATVSLLNYKYFPFISLEIDSTHFLSLSSTFSFSYSFVTGFTRQMTPNGNNGHSQRDPISPGHDSADYKYGRFDASALHIAHALKQTEIQKSYDKGDKPINLYLVSTNKSAITYCELLHINQNELEISSRRVVHEWNFFTHIWAGPSTAHIRCGYDYDWGEMRWLLWCNRQYNRLLRFKFLRKTI